MNIMKRLAVSLVVLLAATPGVAQDVSTLNPLARSYGILGFSYQPPKGEGWREVGSGPDYVQLVYAEQIGADTINTRLAFEAHAFLIPDPTKAPDPLVLAQLSMSQRIQEFKDAQPAPKDGDQNAKDASSPLVAMSKIEPVQAGVPLYEYTLVVKVDEKERFINYFVALSPDKTQYFAAKLETEDGKFRDESYYAPLHASMETLAFAAADKPKTESSKPEPAAVPDEKK